MILRGVTRVGLYFLWVRVGHAERGAYTGIECYQPNACYILDAARFDSDHGEYSYSIQVSGEIAHAIL